jgi:hypothetical protein
MATTKKITVTGLTGAHSDAAVQTAIIKKYKADIISYSRKATVVELTISSGMDLLLLDVISIDSLM